MSDELKPQSIDSEEFRRLCFAVRHCPWRFDGTQPEMAALIAYIDAWRVPAGMKLVPIEPTENMCMAGMGFLWRCGNEQATTRDAELCWSAMIDVAPDKEPPCGS